MGRDMKFDKLEACTPDDLIAANPQWNALESWSQAEDLFCKMSKVQVLENIDSYDMKYWICLQLGILYRSEVARTGKEDLRFNFNALMKVKESKSGMFSWGGRKLICLENYLHARDEKCEGEDFTFVEELLEASNSSYKKCPYVFAWNEAKILAKYTDPKQTMIDPRVVQ